VTAGGRPFPVRRLPGQLGLAPRDAVLRVGWWAAPAAASFRSRCELFRVPPALSSHGFPAADPQVGHRIESFCLRVRSFIFMGSTVAYFAGKRCLQLHIRPSGGCLLGFVSLGYPRSVIARKNLLKTCGIRIGGRPIFRLLPIDLSWIAGYNPANGSASFFLRGLAIQTWKGGLHGPPSNRAVRRKGEHSLGFQTDPIPPPV